MDKDPACQPLLGTVANRVHQALRVTVVISLCFVAALAEPLDYHCFNLGGLYPSQSLSDIEGRLGKPDRVNGEVRFYDRGNLQVTTSFKERSTVMAIHGRKPLMHGPHKVADVGQNTRVIIDSLGVPEEIIHGTDPNTAMYFYNRFGLTVFFRENTDKELVSVLFVLGNREWVEIINS